MDIIDNNTKKINAVQTVMYLLPMYVVYIWLTLAQVKSIWPRLLDWYASDRTQKFMWQPSTQTNYHLDEAGQMGVPCYWLNYWVNYIHGIYDNCVETPLISIQNRKRIIKTGNNLIMSVDH